MTLCKATWEVALYS